MGSEQLLAVLHARGSSTVLCRTVDDLRDRARATDPTMRKSTSTNRAVQPTRPPEDEFDLQAARAAASATLAKMDSGERQSLVEEANVPPPSEEPDNVVNAVTDDALPDVTATESHDALPVALVAGSKDAGASPAAHVVTIHREAGQKWGLMIAPLGKRYKVVSVDDAGAAADVSDQLPAGTIITSINGHETDAMSHRDLKAAVTNPDVLTIVLKVETPSEDAPEATTAPTTATATVDASTPSAPASDDSRARTNSVSSQGTDASNVTIPTVGTAGQEASTEPPIEYVTLRRSVGQRWGLMIVPVAKRYKIVRVDDAGAAAVEADKLPRGSTIMFINGRDTSEMTNRDLKAAVTDGRVLEVSLGIQRHVPQPTDDGAPSTRDDGHGANVGAADDQIQPQATTDVREQDDTSRQVRKADALAAEVVSGQPPTHGTANVVTITRDEGVKWGVKLVASDNRFKVTGLEPDGAASAMADKLPSGTILLSVNGQDTHGLSKRGLATLVRDPNLLELVLEVERPDMPTDTPEETVAPARDGTTVDVAAVPVADSGPSPANTLTPSDGAASGNNVSLARQRGQRWGLSLRKRDGRVRVVKVHEDGAANVVSDVLRVGSTIVTINGKPTATMPASDLKAIVGDPDQLNLSLGVQVAEEQADNDSREETHVERRGEDSDATSRSEGAQSSVTAESSAEDTVQTVPTESSAASTDTRPAVRVVRHAGDKWGLQLKPRDGRFVVTGVSETGAAVSVKDELPIGTIIMVINDRDTESLKNAEVKALVMDADLMALDLVVQYPSATPTEPSPDNVPAEAQASSNGTGTTEHDVDHSTPVPLATPFVEDNNDDTAPEPLEEPHDPPQDTVTIHRDPGQKWGLKMAPSDGRFKIVGVDDAGAAGSYGDALVPDSIVLSINGHDTETLAKKALMGIVKNADIVDLELILQHPL
eukprot:m.50696 g.50696  ORF g.50696 m.50696 type:complete len:937 (-) comp7258_c0_seq1:143-2953(-)